MTYIYYLQILVLLALGFFLMFKGQTKAKDLIFLGVAFLTLSTISAIRYEVGDDYYNYLNIFLEVKNSGFETVFSGRREPGFALLNKLFSMVNGNFQNFYVLCALLTTGLVLLFIYQESKLPFISVFLYISMMFYYWSLSLLRQILAASLCALSVRFIRKKKFIPFLILVLLAGSVHYSALILLPAYFLAQIKFNWKSFAVLGGVALAGFIFAPQVVSIITQYVYKGYSDGIFSQGSSIWYGIFPSFVFAAAWCFKGNLIKQDETNNIYLNFMFYAAVFSLFVARVFILERFAVYFFLPSIVLIPNMVYTLRAPDEKLKKIGEVKGELKTLKGGQLKTKQQELGKLNAEIKDSKIFFGFALGCVITITMLYHFYGFSKGFYHIQDYNTIFNKKPKSSFVGARYRHREYLASIGYPFEEKQP